MTKFVCDKAQIQCSAGSAATYLNVGSHSTTIEQNNVATENYAIPLVNIPSFGICSITGQPCIPVTARWMNCNTSVRCNNQATVMETSALPCTVGGIITIADPNQVSSDSKA